MSAWAERWRPLAIVLLLLAWGIVGTLVGVLLCGCAVTPRDAAVATLNGAADFVATTEQALYELDRAEQTACIDAAGGVHAADEARACVAAVRARYHRAWDAYRAVRRGWLLASAAVQAYDAAVAAKRTPNEAAIAAAVADLVEAELAFSKACDDLRWHR